MEYIKALPETQSDPHARRRCKRVVADAEKGLTDLIADVMAEAPFSKGQIEFGVCAMLALREVSMIRLDAPISGRVSYHAPFHVKQLERASKLTAADVFVSERRRDEDEEPDCVSVAVSAFTAHKDLTTIVMEFRDEFPSFAAIQVVLVGIRRLCVDIEDR